VYTKRLEVYHWTLRSTVPRLQEWDDKTCSTVYFKYIPVLLSEFKQMNKRLFTIIHVTNNHWYVIELGGFHLHLHFLMWVNRDERVLARESLNTKEVYGGLKSRGPYQQSYFHHVYNRHVLETDNLTIRSLCASVLDWHTLNVLNKWTNKVCS